ncbi:ABC transporter ATP-binding protein, partial [Ciceribacter sp. sgz301302]
MLELRGVCLDVGVERHVYDADLVLERGSLNVLLGPTLSGKTSLMRL